MVPCLLGGHGEHPALGRGLLALYVIIRTLAARLHMLLRLKFSQPVSSPLSFAKHMLALPLGEYLSVICRKL